MPGKGKPFEPGNRSGRGWPLGSKNKGTSPAQDLLDRFSEKLMRKCLSMAFNGDVKAMQLLMERLLPQRQETTVKVGKLPTMTIAEVTQSSELVTRMVAEGKITPGQGQVLAELLEGRRKIMETEEMERRLRTLEKRT